MRTILLTSSKVLFILRGYLSKFVQIFKFELGINYSISSSYLRLVFTGMQTQHSAILITLLRSETPS